MLCFVEAPVASSVATIFPGPNFLLWPGSFACAYFVCLGYLQLVDGEHDRQSEFEINVFGKK